MTPCGWYVLRCCSHGDGDYGIPSRSDASFCLTQESIQVDATTLTMQRASCAGAILSKNSSYHCRTPSPAVAATPPWAADKNFGALEQNSRVGGQRRVTAFEAKNCHFAPTLDPQSVDASAPLSAAGMYQIDAGSGNRHFQFSPVHNGFAFGGCSSRLCRRCGNVRYRCICPLTAANGPSAIYSPTPVFSHGTAETHAGGREFQQHSRVGAITGGEIATPANRFRSRGDRWYARPCRTSAGLVPPRSTLDPSSPPRAPSLARDLGRWPSAPLFPGVRG